MSGICGLGMPGPGEHGSDREVPGSEAEFFASSGSDDQYTLF